MDERICEVHTEQNSKELLKMHPDPSVFQDRVGISIDCIFSVILLEELTTYSKLTPNIFHSIASNKNTTLLQSDNFGCLKSILYRP